MEELKQSQYQLEKQVQHQTYLLRKQEDVIQDQTKRLLELEKNAKQCSNEKDRLDRKIQALHPDTRSEYSY